VYDGYWIDIGTPEKYTQVHRDIMDGRYAAAPFLGVSGARTAVSADARVEDGATIEGPCFIDEGVVIKAGARVGPYSVIGRQTQVEENAIVEGAIIWPNCRISRDAEVRNAIVGRNCHVGRNVTLNQGAVLGDKTTLTDFTKA
jgi:NDP-sugar pyrophosphorylase family protein